MRISESLYTSKHLQVVLMSLKPGEDIGEETHPNNDQFFRFEGGKGRCIIDGNEYKVELVMLLLYLQVLSTM